jgi:chaperone LolA
MVMAALAADADERVAHIQKAYENLKDIKGTFSQKSVLRDLKKTDTYKGEFFIKPPLKMKWVYKGDAAQDLTINGDTVLIYKKSDRQAYKSKFDRATYGQTPVALLGGFGDIEKEFIVSGSGDTVVLKPKKPMGNVTGITVTVSNKGFPIRAFTIHDSYSNVIEVTLDNIELNTGLKDSLFDLSLPEGTNLFEQ